ncbi:MAG: LysR family transcriptional regulator [Lachnospiraceae bacterium]|nr:LysR family transcriptional regulator [Lachnospiraceae bacterium]
MTLRDMTYITTIAEEKSITRAAARLYLAQPALSQCVQKVEKELGSPVFIRGTGGVTLTAEGQCFLDFAYKTLRGQKDFEKQLLDLKNAGHGEILLGFTGTQATHVLPYFLPQFKERFPHLEIILVEAPSDEIENRLIRGEIEVGILHPPIIHEELESFEVSRDEMVIIPRSSSRFQPFIYFMENEHTPYLDIEFLRNEPLVLTKPEQRSRMVCEQIFHKAGICPMIRQSFKNIGTTCALAQVGYATTIAPAKQLPDELKRRGYYKIDPRFSVPYSFAVATRQDTYLSVAARKLLELLHEIEGTF